MLTTVVLVQSLSERILPYHHVEVGRVQFFPQMKNNREGQITITAGQSFAQSTRLFLKLEGKWLSKFKNFSCANCIY